MRDAMGDGGVDGVFRHIAAGAEVVVVALLLGQAAALQLHLVGGLQVRVMTSPTRPMAWLSDEMIEKAPMS